MAARNKVDTATITIRKTLKFADISLGVVIICAHANSGRRMFGELSTRNVIQQKLAEKQVLKLRSCGTDIRAGKHARFIVS